MKTFCCRQAKKIYGYEVDSTKVEAASFLRNTICSERIKGLSVELNKENNR